MGQNGFATLSPIDLTPESIELWLANAVSEMWSASLVNPAEHTVLNEIVAPLCPSQQMSSGPLDRPCKRAT
jgi:hypothetical protein